MKFFQRAGRRRAIFRYSRIPQNDRYRIDGIQLCIVLAVLLLSNGCGANGRYDAKDQVRGSAKLADDLKQLFYEYYAHEASERDQEFRPSSRRIRVIDDRVVIDAVAAENTEALKSDLESLGMRHASAFGRIVSGELPIAAIPAMAALTSLNFARAATALLQGGAQ